MLKKVNRLTKNKEFENVFKNGASSYNKLLGVKLTKNSLSFNRFGIIISNKISKKAVERNKIRRRIRSIIESELSFFKEGFDCVIVVLPLILAKKQEEIKKALDFSWAKLKFYK